MATVTRDSHLPNYPPHLQIAFDATDDGVADGDVRPRYVSAEFDRHYSVDLDCSDHARHSDLVTWSKDGQELHDSADYSLPNNGAVLTVRNVGLSLIHI